MFFTLILEEKGVEVPNKFFQISLCNVIYKIIMKIMVNRLKPLLPSLIYIEKVGFVEGRYIIDEILMAHETIHSLKVTKFPSMLIKLDLSKTYDWLN